MKKCGAYVRVSTHEQVSNNSLSTQKKQLKQYARARGWRIHRNYVDPGYSAKDTKRPGLQELLEDAQEHKFDAVVVTRIDRISRSMKDLLGLVEKLQLLNIELVATTQSFDTSHPLGVLILNVLGSFAQFEREQLVERSKEGHIMRAMRGDWACGPVPFGFRKNGKGLELDPAEAPIARLMFELYADKPSIAGVTRELNQQGYRTRRGFLWSTQVVKGILMNPVYTGAVVYNRRAKGDHRLKPKKQWVVVEGVREEIVDAENFKMVQEILRNNTKQKRRSKQYYPLSGKARCPHCGGKLTGKTHHKDGKVYRYYICNTAVRTGGAACQGYRVRAEELEGFN